MRADLPSGTVTFLFTDVEGSTKLLHELGVEGYAETLAEHRRVIREACSRHDGAEVDTQGDAFFFAFPTAPGALSAAHEMTAALADGPIQVRVGLHTGTPLLTEEGYVGGDVHFAARVAASGHGGQILVSSATAVLTGPSGSEPQALSFADLGEHRLKDIDGPVALFQLGDGSFPPLKTISNTNLPRPASSFVGREAELEEVLARIEEGARLVTLTGPGGSGKTRLALEAAMTLVPKYKAGVFWVGLASLRDTELVTETIAQTLGAKDGLAEHIAERELLLLLDNLEQVIEAAPELSKLLSACPNLTLLVTSRELLRVQGEVEYEVPPLAEPEAVSLFCERAQLEPSEEIAELCVRLDLLPLAVELAAARVKALSPAQILERLSQRLDLLKGGRDADPRQQTLRATIEWSYDLLSDEEQRLFACLAVFRGGGALDAAEAVCDADLDTLQSLVEKSLLRFSDGRYWMLETIREYAAERLDESGEAEELRRRHADWFLALAEEAEPHLEGADARVWLDRLEGDYDNVRAALDHLAASGLTKLAFRLVGAMWVFWRDRAHFAEGRRHIESTLTTDERPSVERGMALVASAALASLGGDAATGRLRAEEALALHRTLRDARGTARSELWLGWALGMGGEWLLAREHFEASLRGLREVGNEFYGVTAALMLAWAYDELGDRARAQTLDEENLGRIRKLHLDQLEATTLDRLSSYAIVDGRLDDAASLATASLRIYHDLGDPHGVAIELRRCGHAFALAGRAELAARLLAAGEVLHADLGGTMPWVARMEEEALASVRAQLDDAVMAEAWEQGARLTMDEAVEYALRSVD